MALTPGYAVRGAVQGQGQQMPPEYVAQMKEHNRIKKMVNAYKANPNMYSEGEIAQIQQLAVEAGIPFEMKSSAGSKLWRGAASAVDTALLGLVPNNLYAPRNAGEQKAIDIGSMAGMVFPYGAPFKLAKGALGAGKAAAAGTKTSNKILQGFLKGSGLDKWMGTAAKTTAKGGSKFVKGINWHKASQSDAEFFKTFAKVLKDKGYSNAVKGKTGQDYINAALGYLRKQSKDGIPKDISSRLAGMMRKHMKIVPKTPKTPKVKTGPVTPGREMMPGQNFTMGRGGRTMYTGPGRPAPRGGGNTLHMPDGTVIPMPMGGGGPQLQLPGTPLRLPMPGQQTLF